MNSPESDQELRNSMSESYKRAEEASRMIAEAVDAELGQIINASEIALDNRGVKSINLDPSELDSFFKNWTKAIAKSENKEVA